MKRRASISERSPRRRQSMSSKRHNPQKDCLMIGLQNTGKSVLLRRLKALEASSIDTASRQTVGMEREEISFLGTTYFFAKYGSKMLANWNKMYDSSSTIIFVVDITNSAQIASSLSEFEILMEDQQLEGKPICLAFNKNDQEVKESTLEYYYEMFDVEFHQESRDNFECVSISALTGDGCKKIMNWIKNNCVPDRRSSRAEKLKPLPKVEKVKSSKFSLFCCCGKK
ncbi:unnamed protein product [Moneuplotes crassus]|uniref:Uncharacterized protein n=1 Tax=Euplotes crassus TaxID=5936 RepID=A0AAD1XWQ1_EUPCR|nr:unnamed protein product [Moneuplotes crassus]